MLANEVILQMDRDGDSRALNDNEFWLRSQLKKWILGLASLERTIARQRSLIHWLQEGYTNTHFFHVHARARRQRNHIFSLRRGDIITTAQDDME
jgi:hypothetical protein